MTDTNNNSLNTLLVLTLLHALWVLLNWPIMLTLERYSFDDGTYSHAFLIPIITGYLYYALWQQGKLKFSHKIDYPLFALLLITALCFIQVYSAQISLLYWALSLGVLALSIAFVFNRSFALFAACCYLIFMFPIWNGLTTPLQQISTWVSSFVLSLTSIPIFVEGAFISLPAGRFEIANGCSGLRYLLVSLAISYLYIFLYIKSFKNSVIFIAFAVVGALVTNWIRIVLLILIGQFTEMQSPLMTDHNNFGWYLYIPFLFLLFFLGNRISRKEELLQNQKAHNDNESNKDDTNQTNNIIKNKRLGSMVIACLVLTVSASIWSTINKPNSLINNETINEPIVFNYSDKQVQTSAKVKKFTFIYQCGDLDCKPSFHGNNLTPHGWSLVSTDRYNDKLELIIKKSKQYAKVTAWYQLGDFKTGKVSMFKLYRLKQLPFTDSTPELHWQIQLCQNHCN